MQAILCLVVLSLISVQGALLGGFQPASENDRDVLEAKAMAIPKAVEEINAKSNSLWRMVPHGVTDVQRQVILLLKTAQLLV